MASISRTLEMIQMRKDGHTLEEIGRAYGISKQRVNQIIGNSYRGDLSKIKRVNLRKFFEKTEMSIHKFSVLVFSRSRKAAYMKMHGFLEGSNTEFTILQIIKMCEITGLSFEELIKIEKSEV